MMAGVLFEEARAHLDAVAEAIARAAGTADAVRGILRVNVDPVFNHFVLAARLPEFLARYPELSVELLLRDSVGDLIADRFDLAIRFGMPSAGRLVARRLAEARVLTVAAPSYLTRYGRPSHPREVPAHRLILLQNPATNRPHEWEFRNGAEVVEIAAKGPLLLSDASSMLAACVGGAGHRTDLGLGGRRASQPAGAGQFVSRLERRTVSALCHLPQPSLHRGEGPRFFGILCAEPASHRAPGPGSVPGDPSGWSRRAGTLQPQS